MLDQAQKYLTLLTVLNITPLLAVLQVITPAGLQLHLFLLLLLFGLLGVGFFFFGWRPKLNTGKQMK